MTDESNGKEKKYKFRSFTSNKNVEIQISHIASFGRLVIESETNNVAITGIMELAKAVSHWEFWEAFAK